MQGTVSDRCKLKVYLNFWATSVHYRYYYLVQISGFWEQLGRNQNPIVKKQPDNADIRPSGTGYQVHP